MSNVLKTSERKTNTNPIYLDCNATTPMEPEVQKLVVQFMEEEFGNAGSRTHEFGNRAKVAVQRARDEVAVLVGSNSVSRSFSKSSLPPRIAASSFSTSASKYRNPGQAVELLLIYDRFTKD
jgi:hypothetical protein